MEAGAEGADSPARALGDSKFGLVKAQKLHVDPLMMTSGRTSVPDKETFEKENVSFSIHHHDKLERNPNGEMSTANIILLPMRCFFPLVKICGESGRKAVPPFRVRAG